VSGTAVGKMIVISAVSYSDKKARRLEQKHVSHKKIIKKYKPRISFFHLVFNFNGL
jgi:hypothetical protein